MKKILFILLVLSISNQTKATHLMGGEITWECIKTGSNAGLYVFQLKVYRDCQGVGLQGGPILYLTTHNIPSISSIALNEISITDLSPSCNTINGPNSQFSCNGSNVWYGGSGQGAVEEHIYRSDTIRIIGTPDDDGWHFTWSDCCRNNAITNIDNPGVTGFTLRAVMYPYTDSLGIVHPNNSDCYDSSPKFYEQPRTILEVNNGYDPLVPTNGFTYSHNAFDQEQDSILYSWGQPIDGYNYGYDYLNPNANYVSFVPPYSYTSPISNISLNSITGRTSYPADLQGNYVTCTKVSSYKCGQLVAEIFREIQVILIPPTCNLGDTTNGNFGADTLCNIRPQVQPPFYYPGNSNPYQWDTIVHCGDTVSFDFTATDNDYYPDGTQQSLLFEVSGGQFYNYNDGIACQNPPCATFEESILGTPPPFIAPNGSGTGYFEWITSCNHVISSCSGYQPSVYTFVIKVSDDFCPAPAIENTAQVISITVYPPCDLKANPVVTPSLCGLNNGSIVFNPSGGIAPYNTYIFDMNGFPVDPDSLFFGSYQIRITDSTFCESIDTVVIGGTNKMINSINSFNPKCFGSNDGSISVTTVGGTTPLSYLWTNGDTSSSIHNLVAGQYILSISDSNNCIVNDTILLNEPSLISYQSSIVDVNCFGGDDGFIDLTINGGTFPYSYLWNTGDTTQDISNYPAAIYVVNILDSNDCLLIASISIEEPDDLFAYFNLNYVSCFGLSDGNIDATTVGGTSPYSYQWSSGDSTEDLSNISSDMYILSLTDTFNCFFTDTIVVFEPDQLVASLSFNSGVLVSLGSGGTVPYTYELYDPTGLFANTSNNMGISFTINPVLTGIYILVVTDANGCVDSSEVNVLPSLIYDLELINGLRLYPNPSKDIFNLSFNSLIKQNISISIYSVLGEEVYNKIINGLNGKFKTSFNLNKFGKSVYILEIKTDKLIINEKLILE
jgi:hypothetical protein